MDFEMDFETEETIDGLHNIAGIYWGIFVVLGIILIIGGVITLVYGGIGFIILGIVVIVLGAVQKLIFKWMAHILQNIYEINKNTRKQ